MEGGQMEDLFLDSMEKQSSWFVNWIPFSHRLLSFLVCFVRNMSFSEGKNDSGRFSRERSSVSAE